MVLTSQPRANHSSWALCSWAVKVRSVGVMTTLAPRYRLASACSTPANSLPVMGWAGIKLPKRDPRALRAALTTSALVEPTSMTSICGVIKCLMDLRVRSVAETGTALSFIHY